MLPRHQAEPGGEAPRTLEYADACDRHQRRRPVLPALVRSATGGPVEAILDWFHLSMRVHPVKHVMHGPRAGEPPFAPLDRAQVDVEGLSHLLWNGHHDKTCEALGQITSQAKDAIVLSIPVIDAKARRLVDVARSCAATLKATRAR